MKWNSHESLKLAWKCLKVIHVQHWWSESKCELRECPTLSFGAVRRYTVLKISSCSLWKSTFHLSGCKTNSENTGCNVRPENLQLKLTDWPGVSDSTPRLCVWDTLHLTLQTLTQAPSATSCCSPSPPLMLFPGFKNSLERETAVKCCPA